MTQDDTRRLTFGKKYPARTAAGWIWREGKFDSVHFASDELPLGLYLTVGDSRCIETGSVNVYSLPPYKTAGKALLAVVDAIKERRWIQGQANALDAMRAAPGPDGPD